MVAQVTQEFLLVVIGTLPVQVLRMRLHDLQELIDDLCQPRSIRSG